MFFKIEYNYVSFFLFLLNEKFEVFVSINSNFSVILTCKTLTNLKHIKQVNLS